MQKRFERVDLVIPYGVGIHVVTHRMRDAPIFRRQHAEIEVIHTKIVSHVEIIMRRDGRPRQKNA